MGGYLRNGVQKETRLVFRQTVLFADASLLFGLPRKQAKTRCRVFAPSRLIQGVTPCGEADAQCIRISDPRGLYLTDHFIATHNTTGLAILAVQRFLAGERILYAVPTAEQVNRFWKEVTTALYEPIAAGIFKKNETDHTIELPWTEQRIKAKTAFNADTLRGDYASTLILDEFQLMNEDAWGIVGAPMMLDTNGNSIFCYTPPSFRTAGISKAHDPRHAAKMYAAARQDATGRWEAWTFTSHDNPHLSQEGLSEISQDMTALAYKQEILAEDIEAIPGALWTQQLIDAHRWVGPLPDFVRVVVGIDPGHDAGIVVGGRTADGRALILDDLSVSGDPETWAQQGVSGYHKYHAHALVPERNHGGEMVAMTIRHVDATVNMKTVWASHGKYARAEPVSVLYTQHKVWHVGTFPDLEGEMCTWVPDAGYASPNRLDALVWTLTELLLAAGSPMQTRKFRV